MEISGKVVHELVDVGSKSERNAVVLNTDDGERFLLRRKGGESFEDNVLDELVGSSIITEGIVTGQYLTLEHWRKKS